MGSWEKEGEIGIILFPNSQGEKQVQEGEVFR